MLHFVPLGYQYPALIQLDPEPFPEHKEAKFFARLKQDHSDVKPAEPAIASTMCTFKFIVYFRQKFLDFKRKMPLH